MNRRFRHLSFTRFAVSGLTIFPVARIVVDEWRVNGREDNAGIPELQPHFSNQQGTLLEVPERSTLVQPALQAAAVIA
jgi:hypothetical protein